MAQMTYKTLKKKDICPPPIIEFDQVIDCDGYDEGLDEEEDIL